MVIKPSCQTRIKSGNLYPVSELICLCVVLPSSQPAKINTRRTPNANRKNRQIGYLGLLPIRRMSTLLQPPSNVRGMKELDRDAFHKIVDIPCLRTPARALLFPLVTATLKKSLLRLPKIKTFQQAETENEKIVLLDPEKAPTWESVDGRDVLEQHGLSADSFHRKEICLSYPNFSPHDVLVAVLGDSAPNVAGFSSVGHIVHLNLRSEHEPYKKIIGQVLLDKIPTCRTVINKINQIENEYRNINYELLAGDDDLKTVVKESNCSFHLDYSQVYWNPRLSTEHERLVKEIPPDCVLYDVFAGIGPFAIPAAKKKCEVLANDLNPVSYEYLLKNITVNKVKDKLRAFSMDGRDFIRGPMREDMLRRWKDNPEVVTHIVMNLPALAADFVDVFRGLFHGENISVSTVLPVVHVYAFEKNADEEGLLERLGTNLGYDLKKDVVTRFFVRQVAPSKDMVRLRFELPWNLLISKPKEKLLVISCENSTGESHDLKFSEPESKRQKLLAEM